ncbi:MAG: metallophosphoesterase [Clostridia bacterium]|nr:metallophosphoesterase [Clostridia bacterium]
MKKIISVILAIAMMISIVSVAVSAQEEKFDLEFAVASDLHYNPPREELEGPIDDPIYWYANRRAAMEDESGFIIDEFLRQCAENKNCKYVLISGDLADDGRTRPEDHRAVAEKLRKFEKETGKDVFVINGNHDSSVESKTTFELFKEIYAEFGYDKAITEPRDDCSYAANLGEKYRLIALDSNHPTASTEDGMTKDKLNWVKEQVESAKADGRYPILMMHHNLIDHMPMQRITSRNFIVRNHFLTAERFADWGIKLVVSGHEHCGDGATYTSALGNTIYDFAITSLTMYPLAYEYFKLNDDVITYERKTIDSIDYKALTSTVSGYSDEQINLMKADFNAYAKGFLKAGVQYRLALGFSKEKMGIDEDAIYYGVVRTAVDGLVNLLEMPLYGENSLSELALEYGIELPETDYKTGWDLATDLVAMHYDGCEKFTLDSNELQLFFKAVVTILRVDVADTADALTLMKAANKLLGTDSVSTDITKMCVQMFGTYSAAEYVIMAIVSPFVYMFINDTDGIDDASGSFPGYGTVNVQNNIANIKANVADIINGSATHANLVIKYLLKALLVVLTAIK